MGIVDSKCMEDAIQIEYWGGLPKPSKEEQDVEVDVQGHGANF